MNIKEVNEYIRYCMPFLVYTYIVDFSPAYFLNVRSGSMFLIARRSRRRWPSLNGRRMAIRNFRNDSEPRGTSSLRRDAQENEGRRGASLFLPASFCVFWETRNAYRLRPRLAIGGAIMAREVVAT